MAVKNRWTVIGLLLASAVLASSTLPDDPYKEAVLGFLRPTLRSAKKAGRFHYVVPCPASEDVLPVPYPQIAMRAPSSGRSGLEAVREIFQADERVRVSEEPDGIIKIRVGEVPVAILQTKIPMLRLNQLQQYDEKHAVLALMGTKAVRSSMRKLGLQEAPILYNLHLNLPSKPAPHLSSVIKDVTLDEALDLVAKTFGTLVVFGECTDTNGAKFVRVQTVDLGEE